MIDVAGSGGEDGVWLAEPLEIRARRFRVVFVCGLQEGAWPLGAAPDPFLSDERRRELALPGPVLRAGEDTLDRERYLLYTTVSRATERVVLSYRSSDEEGNLALPSPFVADVAELFAEDWSAGRVRRLLSDVVWDASRAPTERERERSLAAASAPPQGDAPELGRTLTPGPGTAASSRDPVRRRARDVRRLPRQMAGGARAASAAAATGL